MYASHTEDTVSSLCVRYEPSPGLLAAPGLVVRGPVVTRRRPHHTHQASLRSRLICRPCLLLSKRQSRGQARGGPGRRQGPEHQNPQDLHRAPSHDKCARHLEAAIRIHSRAIEPTRTAPSRLWPRRTDILRGCHVKSRPSDFLWRSICSCAAAFVSHPAPWLQRQNNGEHQWVFLEDSLKRSAREGGGS